MILITGASGYIGSHFVFYCIENKITDLVLLDNFSNSDILNIERIEKNFNIKLKFINADINDRDLLIEIFKKNKIESIVHFAGLKSINESLKFESQYYLNNVLGSKNLFSIAKKFKIKHLIFSSSAAVYGQPLFLPITEKHPLSATNNYAQNKIDIENLLLNDHFFLNDCSVTILRYFNPIGAHPSGIIGESPIGNVSNLMPYILNVATKKKKTLLVYGNDYDTHDGTGVRDYIHIMDLVKGHINGLNINRKGISIFNLGTGTGYSVLDIINTFQKVTNITIPFKFTNRRSGDVDSVFADPSKAEIELNWKAEKGIYEMCEDAFRWASNEKKTRINN